MQNYNNINNESPQFQTYKEYTRKNIREIKTLCQISLITSGAKACSVRKVGSTVPHCSMASHGPHKPFFLQQSRGHSYK